MMDACQCESKRSGWQGLTARRGTALGASAIPVITAAVVTATAAAMMAMLAPISARFARRLTAGLAVARATLVTMEMATASAAAATTMVTLATEFLFAAGVDLGLRRLAG